MWKQLFFDLGVFSRNFLFSLAGPGGSPITPPPTLLPHASQRCRCGVSQDVPRDHRATGSVFADSINHDTPSSSRGIPTGVADVPCGRTVSFQWNFVPALAWSRVGLSAGSYAASGGRLQESAPTRGRARTQGAGHRPCLWARQLTTSRSQAPSPQLRAAQRLTTCPTICMPIQHRHFCFLRLLRLQQARCL